MKEAPYTLQVWSPPLVIPENFLRSASSVHRFGWPQLVSNHWRDDLDHRWRGSNVHRESPPCDLDRQSFLCNLDGDYHYNNTTFVILPQWSYPKIGTHSIVDMSKKGSELVPWDATHNGTHGESDKYCSRASPYKLHILSSASRCWLKPCWNRGLRMGKGLERWLNSFDVWKSSIRNVEATTSDFRLDSHI